MTGTALHDHFFLNAAFPPMVGMEEIAVTGFPTPDGLFRRLAHEVRRPGQSVVSYLNIHVANQAWDDPALKTFLQGADVVYCDGAGIVLGSRMLGRPLPGRLTAADWFADLLAFCQQEGLRVFLLGGEPGIAEQALERLSQSTDTSAVIGLHHGYILRDPALEAEVIAKINASQPDLLIVGFGTPLQEHWLAANRDRLNVPCLYAIGAVLDYFAGKVPRCPDWMGRLGLEWLFRLLAEPRRLFGRYVAGNPWFFTRILFFMTLRRLKGWVSLPEPRAGRLASST